MAQTPVDRLVELSMVPELAKEVRSQIVAGAGGAVSWDDVTGKPATFPPVIGTTATTALAGNTTIPAASSTAPAALAAAAAVGTGTTFARADHAHAIPGVSVGAVRGTVLIQAAQTNSTATDVAGLVTDFNALLAKLRTAGIIAP